MDSTTWTVGTTLEVVLRRGGSQDENGIHSGSIAVTKIGRVERVLRGPVDVKDINGNPLHMGETVSVRFDDGDSQVVDNGRNGFPVVSARAI